MEPQGKMRIGFIGAGRLGLALSRALARSGERVVAGFSRDSAKSAALAAAIPGCRSMATAQELADAAELVFVSVSDDAIAGVVSQVRWSARHAVIHCSGAAELDVLAEARRQGAQTGSFHPLQLFSDPEVAAAGLSRCVIALEAAPPLLGELERLVGALGAQPLRVPAGKRAAYHAASHYAAAFICVLLEEGEKLLGALGIDAEHSRPALQALASGTLDAIALSGPARAMAGVYARGDTGTAARHVEALQEMRADSALYRELAERSIRLALEAGRIDAARAAQLRALLGR